MASLPADGQAPCEQLPAPGDEQGVVAAALDHRRGPVQFGLAGHITETLIAVCRSEASLDHCRAARTVLSPACRNPDWRLQPPINTSNQRVGGDEAEQAAKVEKFGAATHHVGAAVLAAALDRLTAYLILIIAQLPMKACTTHTKDMRQQDPVLVSPGTRAGTGMRYIITSQSTAHCASMVITKVSRCAGFESRLVQSCAESTWMC